MKSARSFVTEVRYSTGILLNVACVQQQQQCVDHTRRSIILLIDANQRQPTAVKKSAVHVIQDLNATDEKNIDYVSFRP